jgi:nicotinamidase-related amidase
MFAVGTPVVTEHALKFFELKSIKGVVIMDDAAFLIIDAQVNMFTEGNSVFEGEKILNTLSRLIAQARTAHLPIIYLQNNGGEGDPDIPGTPGWQIHPAVTPDKGDIIIQKHTPDSFHETNLQSELESRHIHNLIVAGMQTDYCVNATCRRAHELGYGVILVQDAHSTYDDDELTASQIIAQYNDKLREKIKVKAANNISFG